MNRGSAAGLVSQLGVILFGAGALATGCSGLARWEPVALPVTEVCHAADVGPAPQLAAATKTVATQESRGFGLNAGVVLAPLSGVGSTAFAGPSGVAQYSDVFDNGFGLGVSVVLRRPAAGTVSGGDIYLLGGVEMLSFSGKQYGGLWVDNATVIGIWLDAKTMLSPVGAGGAWKPYVLCGAGLVRMPEIMWAGTAINEAGFNLGVRGKFGIERRTGKLGFYADFGVQVSSAPTVVAVGLGSAEPLVYTPVAAGVILNF